MTVGKKESDLGTVHGMKIVDTWQTHYVFGLMATTVVNGVDLLVQLGKSRKLAEGEGEFLPAKILKGSEVLWDFSEEKKQYTWARGHLYIYCDPQSKIQEYVVGIIGKFRDNDRPGIVAVIPFLDLVKGTPVKMGDKTIRVGARTSEELMRLKINLARQIKKDWVLNPDEVKMNKMRIEDERRIEEEKREARKKEREALRQNVLGREKAVVFNADGKKIHGQPVAVNEWQCLPDKTPVVVFPVIHDGLPSGEPIEAFFVSKGKKAGKKSGGLKKGNHQTDLSWDDPTDTSIEAGQIILQIEGRREQHLMFSEETVELLREQGVNSGTVVAINNPDADGKYPLASITSDKVTIIGHYQSVEA